MLTLDTPTDTEWATLTGLHRTRWFTNPAANWTDVRRCEQCTNPAVAILDYLTTTLNGDGIAIDPDDHAITYCGLCLPDNLPALISELLWPPLAEETVVEIELDSAWLRLVDAPRTVTDRLGTFALGCAA